MNVSVVALTTVGHETGFEVWCDACGSVAEVTAPLCLGDDGLDQARDSVERAAVMHQDYGHAAIGWDDADPILLGVLPASPEARVGRLVAPGLRRSPSRPLRALPYRGDLRSDRTSPVGPARLAARVKSQNGDPPWVRLDPSEINELEKPEMPESQKASSERVAVTFADVVGWVVDYANDPSSQLPDLLLQLDSDDRDRTIAHLFRLVYHALMKPAHMTDAEYFDRVLLLSRDLLAPLPGDVWSGEPS